MEDKGKDVLFGKSVFGGFRRQDVIRFIDSLQRQHMHASQDEEESLRQAAAQVRQLRQQLDEANAQIARLEAQLQALESSDVQQDDAAPTQQDETESAPAQAAPQTDSVVSATAQRPAQHTSSGAQMQNSVRKAASSPRKGRGLTRFF